MKILFLFLSLTLYAFADVGKIINLELFDNKNPAIITDIEDELNHVVVDAAVIHKEKEESWINTQQGQNYNVGVKIFKRFDEVVFYLRALHTVRGVESDPTHSSPDITKNYSDAELGMATTVLDNIDLGLSYSYEISDYNTTLRNAQLGMRYVDEINLAAVIGMQSSKSDLLVKDEQMFYRVGISRGETSDHIFGMSATYRPKSTSTASQSLLANSQPETYEGVMQFQGDKNFNRSGLRFEYKKEEALVSTEEGTYTQKFRFHTGVKVEREENSYSIFYISYEKKKQATILNHEFELGITLRGFYD